MSLSPEQKAYLDEALTLIAVVGPELGPNGAIVAAAVTAGARFIEAARNNGTDVSDADLAALFSQFDVNKADDLAAQAEATAAAAAEAKPAAKGKPPNDGKALL